MVRITPYLPTLILALTSHVLLAQQGGMSHSRSPYPTSLSPLEVVRNIDDLLEATRLEALESGRINDYTAMVNVAKSFVHAEQYTAANEAYMESIGTIWGQKDQSDLIDRLNAELERANGTLT